MDAFNQITSFPIILHIFLFLLISITLCPLSSHGCHEEERRALLNFKSSLDDPSGRLSTWQEGIQHRNCCDWSGIRCSIESFHVVSIDLRNTKYEDYIRLNPSDGLLYSTRNNSVLRGKLSPYLFKITNLEYLDLGFNDFQKSDITHQFSNLTKLVHLDLSSSNFSASSSKQFSNLTLLQYLDLSCFVFDEDVLYTSCLESPSTKWVRGLVNLQVLRLSGIDLSQATSSKDNFGQHISYLWNLRNLDISYCSISGQDFPIHQFHNLSHLSILKMNSNNYLNSSIPLQLANITSLSVLGMFSCYYLHGSIPYLPQLIELDVHNTKLDPGQLTRMFELPWPKLQTLDISGTQLTESIPNSISNASNLVSFSARYCELQGSLPSSIYNLSRLQYLDLLANHKITGSIHSSISNLKDLNFLELLGNNIQGSLPESICEISSLRYLRLSRNNITGTFPSCITNLQNLSYFDVSYNSISGKVSLISLINELDLTTLGLSYNKFTVGIDQHHLYPSKFKLERLELRSCNIQGYIPASICSFTQLQYLDLSDNNLSGVIPSCINKLKKLYQLDFSKNRLYGSVPLLPPGITSVYLSNNKLSGEISLEVGESFSRATVIYLNDNELSGSIPSSICSQEPGMSSAEQIYLSNNELSGVIPSSIGYCRSLFILNLGNNSLTGSVPNEIQHTNLIEFGLNDNNLYGTFPMFILKLDLIVLNLGNNNFEGNIPNSIGSLEDLEILSLRSNRFNGSIPQEIIHLQGLQILDLSSNNFSGRIPSKLGNLTKLTSKISTSPEDFTIEYQLATKGTTAQFENNDVYNLGVDLSSNSFSGNIPEEIGLLKGLLMLNLSHNLFTGNIPQAVGNMSSLESLDLSSNRLSGQIPRSLTSIDSLQILSLSHNNLSGRIPRGNHFDTLSVDGSAFAGNDLLCGLPLKKDCEGDHNISTGSINGSGKASEDDQEDGEEKLLLYAIVAMGFAVGFWGFFFVLLINKHKWWFPYWRTIDSVAVKIVKGCIQKD